MHSSNCSRIQQSNTLSLGPASVGTGSWLQAGPSALQCQNTSKTGSREACQPLPSGTLQAATVRPMVKEIPGLLESPWQPSASSGLSIPHHIAQVHNGSRWHRASLPERFDGDFTKTWLAEQEKSIMRWPNGFEQFHNAFPTPDQVLPLAVSTW